MGGVARPAASPELPPAGPRGTRRLRPTISRPHFRWRLRLRRAHPSVRASHAHEPRRPRPRAWCRGRAGIGSTFSETVALSFARSTGELGREFGEATVDWVVLDRCLQQLPDPALGLEEIVGRLKPGALLVSLFTGIARPELDDLRPLWSVAPYGARRLHRGEERARAHRGKAVRERRARARLALPAAGGRSHGRGADYRRPCLPRARRRHRNEAGRQR